MDTGTGFIRLTRRSWGKKLPVTSHDTCRVTGGVDDPWETSSKLFQYELFTDSLRFIHRWRLLQCCNEAITCCFYHIRSHQRVRRPAANITNRLTQGRRPRVTFLSWGKTIFTTGRWCQLPFVFIRIISKRHRSTLSYFSIALKQVNKQMVALYHLRNKRSVRYSNWSVLLIIICFWVWLGLFLKLAIYLFCQGCSILWWQKYA